VALTGLNCWEREGGGGGEGDEEEGDDVRSCRLRINEWWF